ncbi:MAG: AMP-binding protein, partial [Gemmatimonadota bacterium]
MAETARDHNENVAAMLWRTAARHPVKEAVKTREHAVTYVELRERATAFAAAVREAGAQPGDRVVILLERGVDAVAAYFGVLAAGGIAVVLNELLRPRQVEYALQHSGAAVLVTSAAMRARVHREV